MNNMEKKEINKVFDDVQAQLDALHGEDATFMFLGYEGNHFVLSGRPTDIEAQIVFAMMRYPVVREIVRTCADRFDELNKEYGDGARNARMDHLIEQNSGNIHDHPELLKE